MKNEQPTFVFFGSGPVAAENLRQLIPYFPVEAVITKPSTLKEMSAICDALVPVYAVENKQQLDALISEQKFESSVGVLIDFGIIVSTKVISTFPKGIVNSHFSLLPEWRGADPITFSILSGQAKTGVSLMLLVEKMDEGPLLATGTCAIKETDTTPVLTDKLIALSTSLLEKNLAPYVNESLPLQDQTDVAQSQGRSAEPTYSRKLTKADGNIDWSKPAEQIEREIRAFIEWPKSYTKLGDIEVIITQGHAIPTNFGTNAGEIEIQDDEAKLLMVQCGEGYLCIDRIKPAGKKDMDVSAFLAGYKSRLTPSAR
ncbi:MAG TPA: methionyl-tRNA formyltransferase [Candidatus Saccharibacteria bacterium]|jgi:methionyl-tRNA formyltransferase|nr:methionyl-tRNA formyltransferase [Candidatus Saccharibacteria bacterium]HMT55728.1 methionyl-tRNA formyltransferase [Candidatus Saccharibacteria bacterium]